MLPLHVESNGFGVLWFHGVEHQLYSAATRRDLR